MDLIYTIRLFVSTFFKCLLVCTFCVFVSSCTKAYTLEQTHKGLQAISLQNKYKVLRQKTWTISQSSNIYIAHPLLSADLERKHPQFASLMLSYFSSVAAQKFRNTTVLPKGKELNKVVKSDKNDQNGFILSLHVVKIEDNYTSHSQAKQNASKVGKDRLTLAIKIYDAYTLSLLDTVVISAQSGVVRANNEHPENMLLSSFEAAFEHF